jgi:hypothetical protein
VCCVGVPPIMKPQVGEGRASDEAGNMWPSSMETDDEELRQFGTGWAARLHRHLANVIERLGKA